VTRRARQGAPPTAWRRPSAARWVALHGSESRAGRAGPSSGRPDRCGRGRPAHRRHGRHRRRDRHRQGFVLHRWSCRGH